MVQDTRKIIERMAARLFPYSINGYQLSEHFSRFCSEPDLDDAWKESLQLSRDRPDLYGDAVIKNAFVLFLDQSFHSRPDKFPAMVTCFLTGFSQEISQPLPLDDLKSDLMDLGYSGEDLEKNSRS